MGARVKGYFEGRLLKAASNRDVLKAPNLFTRDELGRLHLHGKPLFYEHHKEKGQIGKIVTNYVDTEGYLVVGCQLDLANDLGKIVYKAIKDKQLTALSVGLDHTDPNQTSVTSAEELFKDIIETSVTANPKFKDALIHSCFSEETRSLYERLATYTTICDIKMAQPGANTQQPTLAQSPPSPAAAAQQQPPPPQGSAKRREPEQSNNNDQHAAPDDNSDAEPSVFDLREAAKKSKEDLLRDMERLAEMEKKQAKKLKVAQKQLEESKDYKQQAAELAELKTKKTEKYATKNKDLFEELLGIAKEEKVDTDPKCVTGLQNLCGNPELKTPLRVIKRMRAEGVRLVEENKKLRDEIERITGDAKATGYALERISQKRAPKQQQQQSASAPAPSSAGNPWLSPNNPFKFDSKANRMVRTEASDKGDPLGVDKNTQSEPAPEKSSPWDHALLQGRDANRYQDHAANSKFNPFAAGKNQ